jgi:hypothetical protein
MRGYCPTARPQASAGGRYGARRRTTRVVGRRLPHLVYLRTLIVRPPDALVATIRSRKP